MRQWPFLLHGLYYNVCIANIGLQGIASSYKKFQGLEPKHMDHQQIQKGST